MNWNGLELPEAYYQDNDVYIIKGDTAGVLPVVPSECIDMIITSPPYNFGMGYSGYDDNRQWNDYFVWLDSIFARMASSLKVGGRLALNIQPLFSSYQPTHRYVSSLLEKHLLWKGEILWEKNNYNCKYTAWGSWKSPSMPYLKYTWEFVELFCKDSYRKAGRQEDIDITADEFKQWTTAKWSIAPEAYDGHPAVMPKELVRRLLKLFSYRGDLILDPFLGSGTTAYCAKIQGRKCIGIEIEEKYCEISAKRCNQGVMKLGI